MQTNYFYGLLIALFSTLLVRAQQDVPLQLDVIPPSPQAASLGKYGDIPVSNYTGLPQINIPLLEISSGPLSHSLSLSYHAGGIKVEEEASLTGLGWALQGHAMISRTVRGKPDEEGFLYGTGHLPDLQGQTMAKLKENPAYLSHLEAIADGEIDTQPDVFYFNAGGVSGKFTFGGQGPEDIVLNAAKPYRIHYVNQNRFIIRDITGTQYVFGTTLDGSRTALEVTKTQSITTGSPHTPPRAFTSVWHLVEIISADRVHRMDFYYRDYSSRSDFDPGMNETRLVNTSATWQSKYSRTTTSTFRTSKALYKIAGQERSIVLEGDDRREDMRSGYKITGLVLRDGKDRPLKKQVLRYDYFGTPSSKAVHKRLRLTQVESYHYTPQATWERIRPPHRFEYNTRTALPPKDSFAQDHWGYYNGRHNNQTLIPAMEWNTETLAGSDRSPDASYAQAGVLERITYPTGGSTHFTYEGHDVPARQPVYRKEQMKQQVYAFCDDRDPDCECDHAAPCGNKRVHHTHTFARPARVHFFITVSYSSADLHKPGLYINLFPDRNFSPQEVGSTTLDLYAYVQKGTELDIRAHAFFTDAVSVLIDWEEETGEIETFNRPVGGLRIRQIRHEDGIHPEQTRVQTFVYTMPDNPDKSGGRLVHQPVYHYLYSQQTGNKPGGYTFVEYLSRTSRSQAPLSNTQGSPVGYTHVTVYEGTPVKNQGKTVYTYSFDYDAGEFGSFPFPPPTSREYKRGNLLETGIYSLEGQKETLLQRTRHHYRYNDREGDPYFQEFVVLTAGRQTRHTQPELRSAADFLLARTFLHTHWVYRDSTHTTVYDPDDPARTRSHYTVYAYDNPDHLQPTRIRQSADNGEELVTYKRYPQDILQRQLGSRWECTRQHQGRTQQLLQDYHACVEERMAVCGAEMACYSRFLDCHAEQGHLVDQRCRTRLWGLHGEVELGLSIPCALRVQAGKDCQGQARSCWQQYQGCALQYPCEQNLQESWKTVFEQKIACEQQYTAGLQRLQEKASEEVRGIANLVQHGILHPVIEEYTVRQNADGSYARVIAASVHTYKPVQPYPAGTYTWKAAMPVDFENFSPAGVQEENGSSILGMDRRYELRATYPHYDARGNPRVYQVKDAPVQLLHWDTKGILPTAQATAAAVTVKEYDYSLFEESKSNISLTGIQNPVTWKQFTLASPREIIWRTRVKDRGNTAYPVSALSVTLLLQKNGKEVYRRTFAPGSHTHMLALPAGTYVLQYTHAPFLPADPGGTQNGMEVQLNLRQRWLSVPLFYTGFEQEEGENIVAGAARTGQHYFRGDYTWAPPPRFPQFTEMTLSYWYLENGTWHLHTQPYSRGTVVLDRGEAIDEVRIFPRDARVTTVTYDRFRRPVSQTDHNHEATSMEYDPLTGRPLLQRDRDGQIREKYEYEFGIK